MNSHFQNALDRASNGALVHIATGQALPLGGRGGELTVVAGSVWLTRLGDPADHVIERGERMLLRGADRAVIEPTYSGATATVRWHPRRAHRLSTVLFAAPLRALAVVAGRAAAGFAALARHAAASARRAQGCLSVGNSIASSAALK